MRQQSYGRAGLFSRDEHAVWFKEVAMCGRITQYRKAQEYMQALDFPPTLTTEAADRAPSYNTPPGSTPWLIHAFDDGMPKIDAVKWGYRPTWAAEKGIPLAINARIEKAATGRYFRHMWLHGRVLVPADGWYEWTGKAGHKQPWYIHRKTNEPLFLAAITNVRPDRENHEGSGFVIVTAAADVGMVDIHDRRPVVLAPVDARLWMDPDLPAEQAEHLARSMAVPADEFTWYPVSKAVNRVGSSDPQQF
jgi:putative SOS response-associated peptidase YedK